MCTLTILTLPNHNKATILTYVFFFKFSPLTSNETSKSHDFMLITYNIYLCFYLSKATGLAIKKIYFAYLQSIFHLVNITVYFSSPLHERISTVVFNKCYVWFDLRESLVSKWILRSEVFTACGFFKYLIYIMFVNRIVCHYKVYSASQQPLYFSSRAHHYLLHQKYLLWLNFYSFSIENLQYYKTFISYL